MCKAVIVLGGIRMQLSCLANPQNPRDRKGGAKLRCVYKLPYHTRNCPVDVLHNSPVRNMQIAGKDPRLGLSE